jgi:Fe-S cluster assembly iron-binding protein IscA
METMTNIQVTDKASKELLTVLQENEKKKIRLYIQGIG